MTPAVRHRAEDPASEHHGSIRKAEAITHGLRRVAQFRSTGVDERGGPRIAVVGGVLHQ